MKFLLLILALVGSACALQYPVEYHYKYEGRVATGIPSIRAQVAALGVRAQLILQMKTKSQGLVKLTNVEVGEFNGDLNCAELRLPVPLKWSPMPNYQQQVQMPFAVSFTEEEGDVMKVPQSDVEFVTNIRKSVVEALRLEPVVANLGGIKGDRLAGLVSGGKAPDAFSLEEETLFGRCESQYTLTKLPKYLSEKETEEIEKHLKVDEQTENSPRSRGPTVPKLKEEYWRLVRAINLDKCNDRVVLQHSGMANMSHTGYGQFNAIQSRSSVGTFILKGKPGAFRIERAIIEGDVIANPFGFKTQRIQTITNQTLVLESAQAIQTPIQLPSTRNVKTWRYEVASPFTQPEGHVKPWVNYYNKNDKYSPINVYSSILGLPESSSMIQEYERNFLGLLDETVRKIYEEPSAPSTTPSWQSTKESVATTYLFYMTRMMRILPQREVEQIFSRVFSEKDVVGQRKQMLLSDIAAASGAAAPIHVLLQKIKSGQISPQRIGSIFMTMPNNLYAPSIIPELVEYAKTVDIERNPVLASTVLINTASLVEKVCLNHKKFNYTVPNPLYGRNACKPSEIINNFLPYLKQKAEGSSKSWERSIFVQAIANLGTPASYPVLKPFIYGQHDSDRNVRIVAIYGLTKKRMPDSMRETVFRTLMEVVENVREVPEIREVAFLTLLTWHPDTAVWQRMARMTWREHSESMAAFVTTTIQSMAKSTEPHLLRQARIAAFVLPLMKPFSPSIKYSHNHLYSRFNEPSKVGVLAELVYIHSLRDYVPREVYSAIKANIGDMHLQIFEAGLSSTGLSKDMFNLIHDLGYSSTEESAYPYSLPRGFQSEAMKDIVGRMQTSVEKTSEQTKEANIYVRAFDNMYQYIPLNSEVVAKLAGEEGSHFIQKLLQGQKMNITKFFSPIELGYIVPTEIGLPLVGTVSMPTMNVGDVEVKLLASEMSRPTISELMRAKTVTLLLKSNYKYMSKMLVKMEVPAPWNKKIVEAGIENLKLINLPVYANLTLNHTSEMKNVTFNIAPFTQQQFPVVHGHNIPYTQVRDMVPSQHLNSDYKVIAIEKSRSPVVKMQSQIPKKYTGLSMEMTYHGDAPFPFNTAFATDYIQKPEKLVHLLVSPTAKQWQYSLNMHPESSSRNISLSLAYLTPSKISGRSGRIPEFSAEDTIGQRLEKLRNLSEGSQVYGLNAQLIFNGTEYRKYEALTAFTRKSQSQQTKEYKVVAAVLADRIPGFTQSPKALCAEAQVTTPEIRDVEMLKQIIRSRPHESIHGQVYYGRSCSSPQILSFQGSMEVSSERISRIQEEITSICNYDQLNPTVELQTPAIYDQGHLEIQFSKEKMPEKLLNATYSLQKTVEGVSYPHGYYNEMHRGQQNKITITTTRPLSSQGYTFWVEQPQQYSIFQEIYVPYGMTRIVPLTGLKTSFNQYTNKLMITEGVPRSCSISSSSVNTYDGLRYSYNPLQCWTTAALDRRNSGEFIVNTRKSSSGEFEAQILISNENAEVIITRSKAVVNGQTIPASESRHIVKDHSGRVIMEIRKQPGHYEVYVPQKLTVKVMEEIQVIPESPMKGHLRGLCGDFDGETTYDKAGPQGCLYTDMELFKYAWTHPQGEGCDKNTVSQWETKVNEFQQHCEHVPTGSSSELKSVYEKKMSNSYIHVYPVKKESGMLCVSQTSVKHCAEGFSLVSKRTEQKTGYCWPVDSAPQVVKDAEASKGYLLHQVREEPKTHQSMTVVVAISCKPSY